MHASDRVISNHANGFYDPHTGTGIPLDGCQPAAPVIHECGLLVLGMDWCYRDICSPFWRAYANLDSGAAVRVAGSRIPLRPGCVTILPEETLYDCLPKAGVRHLWIHFSLSGTVRTAAPATVRIPPGLDWEALASGIRKAAPAAELAALCLALLVPSLAAARLVSAAPADPAWSRFVQWIDSRHARPATLAEMSAWAGMSTRSFLRWFARHGDGTPARWLVHRRIREACRLLRFSQNSIEQISEAAGFANRNHFTRAFAAETGTTPACFRKQGRGISRPPAY